jgi:large subunit ribosomal protein L10
MSKNVKELIQQELENRFRDVNNMLVVSLTGVKGVENNQMRGALKDRAIRLLVVRNLLMKRALEKIGIAAAGVLFTGPCAVAYGGESVVDIAKEISSWSEKLPGLERKGAYVEGRVLDAEAAGALSKMPNLPQLRSEVVVLANTPAWNLARVLVSPSQVIAGCIKTIIEKAEKQAA